MERDLREEDDPKTLDVDPTFLETEELIPGDVNVGGLHGVCLPPAREHGARRPAVLPPVAIVSHGAGGLAVKRPGAASHRGRRLRADVTPKCGTGVSLWFMLPPGCCELSE